MRAISNYETGEFLFILTIIQCWWIAIWGLAYIGIEAIAGKSKNIEVLIYLVMLIVTIVVLRVNPRVIDRL